MSYFAHRGDLSGIDKNDPNKRANAARELQKEHVIGGHNVGDDWHKYISAWMYPAYHSEYNHDHY